MIFSLHAVTVHPGILKPVTCSVPSRLEENIISTSLRSDNLLGPERIKSAILMELSEPGEDCLVEVHEGKIIRTRRQDAGQARGAVEDLLTAQWTSEVEKAAENPTEDENASRCPWIWREDPRGPLIPTEHVFWPHQWL